MLSISFIFFFSLSFGYLFVFEMQKTRGLDKIKKNAKYNKRAQFKKTKT